MSTATDIIEALGGSTLVSRETGFPLTTIESWKAANFIPDWRREALLAFAEKQGKRLAAKDFPPKSARISRPRPQDASAAA